MNWRNLPQFFHKNLIQLVIRTGTVWTSIKKHKINSQPAMFTKAVLKSMHILYAYYIYYMIVIFLFSFFSSFLSSCGNVIETIYRNK